MARGNNPSYSDTLQTMTRKDNPLLTASEVAQHCGLHPNTITGYHTRGQMPPPDKQYGRTPLWRQTTIDNWRNNVTHPNAKTGNANPRSGP